MFGHLGFSYVGLVYLLMLFIPNIIWSKHQPVDYVSSRESKILLVCERIGQICCSSSILIFRDYNIKEFSGWSVWLAVSFVLMLLYESWWIRYFTHEHTELNFYRSFYGVPFPGASLPVVAFLLMGIYGKVIWLMVSSILLGIGHIGIHWQHMKHLNLSAR